MTSYIWKFTKKDNSNQEHFQVQVHAENSKDCEKCPDKDVLEIDQSQYNAAIKSSEGDIEKEFENLVSKNQSKNSKTIV